MPDTGMPLRVANLTRETGEITVLELVSGNRDPLPPFTPGSHIDVRIAPSLIRQYSLCNAPTEQDRYVIAVKREARSRGGSEYLHTCVRAGDTLTVGTPRNHFPLAPHARRHLLLAGGIGITPLLSMARHLQATGQQFCLKYFARSADAAAFRAELAGPQWSDAIEFLYGLDPSETERYLCGLMKSPPLGEHIYLCGPQPFMKLVERVALGTYSADHIHMEYFSADTERLQTVRASFRIRCERSDKELDVAAEETIVDALKRHGIAVDVMCQEGVCGTCLVRVLEGTPDHRDAFLNEDERRAGNQMLVCCSRSCGPLLVLDI